MAQAQAQALRLNGVPWDLSEHEESARSNAGRTRRAPDAPTRANAAPLCAGCRRNEARYGFRVADAEPGEDRPRTLCFSCFRIELDYRQAVAARLARGWNAEQVRLPLNLPERLNGVPFEETLHELTRRRRRAQIAARHALGE
jgi:hypothetical protein